MAVIFLNDVWLVNFIVIIIIIVFIDDEKERCWSLMLYRAYCSVYSNLSLSYWFRENLLALKWMAVEKKCESAQVISNGFWLHYIR